MDIKKKIKELPGISGVYIFKDKKGQVIYVGKAGSLKARVSSYFQKGRVPSPRTDALVSKVQDINYIPTINQAEALLLEYNLIKQHKPRYNVMFKDDKSYPYLKLSVNEEFPGLYITRDRKNDRAIYYGPYTNVQLLKQALTLIRRIFPFRTCRAMPKRPCLYFHLGQCPAPCLGRLNEYEYKDIVGEIKLFLEGRKSELIKELFRKMKSFSERKDFEAARNIRDRIQTLSGAIAPGKGTVKQRQLRELQGILGLTVLPVRIEAFDVSNITGKSAVGSVVSFFNARADKNNYRKFRIKSVKDIDDYRMIKEVVSRRYKRLIEEEKRLPDLIMIDGGKGHLNCALDEMRKLGLKIPVMAVAKKFEHIFIPNKKGAIVLSGDSRVLHLLKRIRDEAHRFAHKYHGDLRRRESIYSELDKVRGVGDKRKKELIRYFGSMEGVKKATSKRLMKVRGIDARTAKEIIRHFKK